MAILGVANSVVGIAAGIFGGDSKNAERKQIADALYQRALNGDVSALHQLDCLSGSQTYAVEFGATAPPGCGFGSDSARAYASSLLVKLKGKQIIAQTAGNVASGATKVGLDADPRTYTATVASNVGNAIGFPAIPQWAIFAGGAALLVWFLKGR